MKGDLRAAGIVGLGLMGGSLARGLRQIAPAVRIVAVEPDPEIRARAESDRLADLLLPEPGPALSGCDLVVLCTPLPAAEELLEPLSRLAPGVVLTDLCPAKEALAERVRAELGPEAEFVGGHPLFGGRGGYAAARADLWRGGTVALCTDTASPAAVDRVARLHERLGARVVRCRAREHDEALALVSHLPHLVAAALSLMVKSAGAPAAALAGPVLRDVTRPAAFPFDPRGEAARRNRHLPAAAERLRAELGRLLSAIADSPEDAQRALEAARDARGELS